MRERTSQLRLDFRRNGVELPEEARREAKTLLQQLLGEAIDGESKGEDERDEREDHDTSS